MFGQPAVQQAPTGPNVNNDFPVRQADCICCGSSTAEDATWRGGAKRNDRAALTREGALPPPRRVQVPQSPSDGISALCWSPKQNYLVATSWDAQVRCYEVQAGSGSIAPRASVSHDAPLLAACWHHDGGSVFSAGCDKQAKRWDLGSNQQVQVAAHDAPIRHCAWVPEVNLLITGSWDKTLRYWDTRSPSAALTVTLPERCYALSVTHPLLVVATADRHMLVYNLSNPQTVYKQIQSPLKYQTRCVAAFPDKSGYLVGSIEGRVAVQHVEESLASRNFTFKCHREPNDGSVCSVNSVVFHPVHGTFVTTGSDATYNFWDKDSKQRLKAMQKCAGPIPCGAYNADGSIYAYAVSYDWSKGAEAHNPATATNTIYLHQVQEQDVKPRQRTTAAAGNKR